MDKWESIQERKKKQKSENHLRNDTVALSTVEIIYILQTRI